MSLLPVLQIIHVTDLHVKHINANYAKKFYAKRRYAARFTQNMIERFDLFGWNEGTQGHYPHAPESFLRFLQKWRDKDKRWYGKRDDEDSAQSWLVDTGDLTAFGDEDSVKLGKQWLRDWCANLGDIDLLSLYGNHDAWPEAHPALAIVGRMQDDIRTQRDKILKWPEWRPDNWLDKPLSVKIPSTGWSPGTESRIELYALDTVCWNASANTLAVGSISAEHLEKFRSRLKTQWTNNNARHFRILATHHPLAFPHSYRESHVLFLPFVPSMKLLQAARWVRELRNDRDIPRRLGSLAHLFLSGHTHIAYPAGDLPKNVTDIHQGLLAPNQLQLVGGPLMLNKSEKAANTSNKPPPAQSTRKKPRYSLGAVDASNCQAQVLRFFADTEQPGQLVMFRIPVWSEDGSEYREDMPSAGVRMFYNTP